MSRGPRVEEIDPAATVLENARRVLAMRMAEFYAYEPVVPHPELAEALHDLRIAAKRLRYTLELFRAQFGERGERQIERLKAIQEALGHLHDHDVRIALTGEELARIAAEQHEPPRPAGVESPGDPRPGLLALQAREREARASAYGRFRAIWERCAAEGMRAELVALSAAPATEESEGEEPA